MKLEDAKNRFVQIWGTVGVEWGINRTMAQVHGLLLTSDQSLTSEQVMEALRISRGNANMNLRELISWGLVYRENRAGERKEYFYAEKDIWEVAQRIVAERKRRELDPMMKMIDQLKREIGAVKFDQKEAQSFDRLLTDIQELGKRSSTLLEFVLTMDQSSFFKPLMALLKK
jgi:DNA-binding transcriptional regulator GbsR (MarR family)